MAVSSVSPQFRAVSNSAPKNPTRSSNVLNRAADEMPVLLLLGIQTLSQPSPLACPLGAAFVPSPLIRSSLSSVSSISVVSTVSGTRLMPKVDRPGSGASKKWIGKLLVSPPSENQHRSSEYLPFSGRTLEIRRVERHGAQQNGKAQAHACAEQDRQVRRLGNRVKTLGHFESVPVSNPGGVLDHPVHHGFWKQLVEFASVEIELAPAPFQERKAVGDAERVSSSSTRAQYREGHSQRRHCPTDRRRSVGRRSACFPRGSGRKSCSQSVSGRTPALSGRMSLEPEQSP